MANTIFLMNTRYFYTFSVISYHDPMQVIINVRDRHQNDVQVKQVTVDSTKAREIFDALRQVGCVAFKDKPACPYDCSQPSDYSACETCRFATKVKDPMWCGYRIRCSRFDEWL